MNEIIALVGFDEPEYTELQARLNLPVVAHPVLPRMLLRDGQLWMEATNSARMMPVSQVIYHAILEDDLDFIAALALWGGACLPNPLAMLDCRLRLPCLARALRYSRFGAPQRGYAAPKTRFTTEIERVAKWGNWHCGEDKTRFTDSWLSDDAAIIEPFIPGQAVRIVMIGERYWQIRLEGENWLKSIHHADAAFMPVDAELLDDTRAIKAGFGLEVIGNDYIVSADGSKHLLEVNHIPNVTRFPEVWQAYGEYVQTFVANHAAVGTF
jgi:hypothetical protein